MIGLFDCDRTKEPNLALMKISAWHKLNGDHVEFVEPIKKYEKIYVSKVFDYSLDYQYENSDQIIRGGVGFHANNPENDIKLPREIEHIYPDYELYNTENAYGFLTRGCPRNCGFCNVTSHQGKKSIKVSNVEEFWKGQKKIVLYDPNIMACKDKYDVFDQLAQTKVFIDFNQGIDVRMATEKAVIGLNKLKIKRLHTAWDNYEFETYKKLKEFLRVYRYANSSVEVYVLVNFNTTFDQDLERIYMLRELGVDPYVMIYDKDKLKKGHKILRLQRWVNNKMIWRKTKRFEDYI